MKNLFTRVVGVCCSLITILLLTTSSLHAQYCAFAGTTPAEDYIANVTFAGIDNTTGATGYSDFTDITGVVSPGLEYEISVLLGNDGTWTETATVYIDWDQSETFDADERYDLGSCTSSGCATALTAMITVPVDATPGETRMRVIGKFSTPPVGPCATDGTMTFGEVEDYSINVLSGECTPPNFTYTIINDCEADNYDVSAYLEDFGTNTFVTILFTRSDDVTVNPATLIFALEGQNITILNNIPFGVTVNATIVSQNEICNLTRNFAEEVCPVENDIACEAIELQCGDNLSDMPFLGGTLDDDNTCNGTGYADVWYTFTSDGSVKYIIDETQIDAVTSLYSGDECGNLTPITVCSDAPENFTITQAGTYFYRVQAWSASQNFHGVSLTCVPFDCPELLVDAGTPCDDGNPDTYQDVYNSDCECEGYVPIPGEICEVPLVINTLPYITTDNTINYFDDYSSSDFPPLAPGAIVTGGTTGSYIGGDDVVYAYTPVNTESIDISVTNHDTWTGVYIFTGCPFELTHAGFSTSSATTPLIISGFVAQAGQTYYIVISTFPSPQSTTYTLSMSSVPFDCPLLEANFGSVCDDGDANTTMDTINEDCECAGIPIPANDEPCFAFELSCGDTLSAQNLIGATPSFDDACFGSGVNDIWYTFTVNTDQAYSIAEIGTGDMVVSLHQGDECGNLEQVGNCFDTPESFAVTEPGTYYFRIRAYSTATTAIVTLNCYDIPANDDCIGAIALACGDTLTNQSLIGANQSFDDACGGSGTADIWYSFTAEEGFAYQVSEIGTGDMVVSLHQGDDCGNLVQVGNCQDSPENFSITTAGDYYFRVRPYSTATTATVTLSCYEIPTNDDCEEAIEITCGETYTGTTVGAAAFSGVPAGTCGTTLPSATNGGVWYTITPTNDTEIDLDLTGSSFDTKIFMYTNECGSLECFTGNDDGGEGTTSRIQEVLDAGTTYYIFISGYLANRGDYVLNVSCVDLICSPTIDSAVPVNEEGEALECVDLGTEFYLEVTLSGGTQAAYNVTAGNSPVTVINANSSGLVGPITGFNPTVNAISTTNPNCGAALVASTVVCPPTNDEACNATPISCGETITQNFQGATLGFDDSCGGTGDKDVWFVFTADGTQAYTIAETGAAFFDAVVGLYQGDDCGNLISVAPCRDSPENYTVTMAGTYYFVVRPWSSTSTIMVTDISLTCTPFDCPGVGNVGLPCDDGNPNTVNDVVTATCECTGVPVVANDEACTATVLECGDSFINLPFAGSTQSVDDACFGSGVGDVWFTFEADGSQTYLVAETQTDVVVDLWTGDDCGNLVQVSACADSPESVAVTEAGTYYFRIRPYGTATTYGVSLTCTPFDCPEINANIGDACDDGDPTTAFDTVTANCDCIGIPSPVNDECADALPLVCGETYTGTTNGAIPFTGVPAGTCGTTLPAATNGGVWYVITPSYDTEITLDLSGSSFDTKIFLYEGVCGELVCVGGDDDGGVGTQSLLTTEITAGTTYYVFVSGYNTAKGNYILTVSCTGQELNTLNGSVNWNSNCDERAGTVTLYTPNTATVVETYNVTVSPDGTYTIEDIQTGTFDIIVKIQGHLAKGFEDVEIVAGANTHAGGAIRNGNVNNDNAINIFDLSVINMSFNKAEGQSGFNPLADLNCDGSVNIFDISILNASFNKVGAVAPL